MEKTTHNHAVAHNHTKSHNLEDAHAHFHSPEEKKKQLNRLARIIGHLNYVKRMIEDDEDCADVLNQLAASKSAINSLGKVIINEHISHCVYHAMEDGDTQSIEEFMKSIQNFI